MFIHTFIHSLRQRIIFITVRLAIDNYVYERLKWFPCLCLCVTLTATSLANFLLLSLSSFDIVVVQCVSTHSCSWLEPVCSFLLASFFTRHSLANMTDRSSKTRHSAASSSVQQQQCFSQGAAFAGFKYVPAFNDTRYDMPPLSRLNRLCHFLLTQLDNV